MATVSTCCSAPVEAAGHATRYYVCTRCGEPCDGIDEDADRAWRELVQLGQELAAGDADRH